MSTPKYLVTGASGQLGRRVVALLIEEHRVAPASIVAATRKPEGLADLAAKGVDVRAADFEDGASLEKAFAGVTRALLVSTDALDRPGRRLEQHRRAVAALAGAGVAHVVYTSVPNPYPESPVKIGLDHLATEQLLQATRLGYTILRNSLYTDLMLHSLPGAVASGSLVDARGTGKAAFVTREDCARAAAAALVRGEGRTILDVTGPEAIDSAALAAIVSEVTKKPVAHTSVPRAALVDGLVAHGVPAPYANVFADFDEAIAKGDLHVVSSAVEALTGKKPESVASFLARNAGALGG